MTAIVPHGGDMYRERVVAAIEVLNGSREITGRTFVHEMGVLDAPIMLANSFNVPRVADAVIMISRSIVQNPRLAIEARYVHPVVAECSELKLSDIQGRHVGEVEVAAAWSGARRTRPPNRAARGPLYWYRRRPYDLYFYAYLYLKILVIQVAPGRQPSAVSCQWSLLNADS